MHRFFRKNPSIQVKTSTNVCAFVEENDIKQETMSSRILSVKEFVIVLVYLAYYLPLLEPIYHQSSGVVRKNIWGANFGMVYLKRKFWGDKFK